MSSPQNPQFDPQLVTSDQHEPAPFVVPPPVLLPQSPAPKANENPVWSGWDVLRIAVLTLFLMFFTQLFIVLAARHYAFPHESWLTVAEKPALTIFSELLTYIVIALYMILLVEGKYHARFLQAIRWNWPGRAAMFLGIGVLMLGLDLMGRFLPMPKSTPFDQFFASPFDAYLTAIFAISLGPLWEELLFRGFLYPVLARRLGVVWGIVLTAVPFGLIHYFQYRSWGAVLIIFLVGVILTTVRAVTKSVASSFLAHAGYNTTLMVLAAVATDGFRHMENAGVLLAYLRLSTRY